MSGVGRRLPLLGCGRRATTSHAEPAQTRSSRHAQPPADHPSTEYLGAAFAPLQRAVLGPPVRPSRPSCRHCCKLAAGTVPTAVGLITPRTCSSPCSRLSCAPALLTCADVYVFCCSYSHNVAPRDKWIAFVSTTVETSDPQAELAPGGWVPSRRVCPRGRGGGGGRLGHPRDLLRCAQRDQQGPLRNQHQHASLPNHDASLPSAALQACSCWARLTSGLWRWWTCLNPWRMAPATRPSSPRQAAYGFRPACSRNVVLPWFRGQRLPAGHAPCGVSLPLYARSATCWPGNAPAAMSCHTGRQDPAHYSATQHGLCGQTVGVAGALTATPDV